MVGHRDRAARLGAALGLTAALVGCTGGGGSPAPSGAAASATATVVAATAGAASPTQSPPPSAEPTTDLASPAPTVALPASPPAAFLAGLAGGGTAAGALGSYTWAGGGSDAPWVVGKNAENVKQGALLRVSFDGVVPVSWTAAWARVVNGAASTPSAGTGGAADATLTAPATAGAWTVRVTATFGPGANATYYWRLTVAP